MVFQFHLIFYIEFCYNRFNILGLFTFIIIEKKHFVSILCGHCQQLPVYFYSKISHKGFIPFQEKHATKSTINTENDATNLGIKIVTNCEYTDGPITCNLPLTTLPPTFTTPSSRSLSSWRSMLQTSHLLDPSNIICTFSLSKSLLFQFSMIQSKFEFAETKLNKNINPLRKIDEGLCNL